MATRWGKYGSVILVEAFFNIAPPFLELTLKFYILLRTVRDQHSKAQFLRKYYFGEEISKNKSVFFKTKE